MSGPAATPDAGDPAYWNGPAGRSWVAGQERMDATFAPLTEVALALAAPRPGERVLDIGCGCGGTLLALADRVGSAGEVLGLDVSAPMLARAAERAAGLPQVRTALGDAAAHPLPPAHFDLGFSRFGVMFFRGPVGAFRHIRAALRPGGRLVFICWRALAENDWA
ncbi:MAG TPA: methyltransferase domain-containing protein, partial [Crenalkalicoccus sp.]|nr:methyltransferase domain-containing protein [Crenalkalicoccus sp.]